jgi:hypothetical protein
MSMTMRRIESVMPEGAKRFSDGIMHRIEGHA